MSPALAGGFLTTVPPGKPQRGEIFLTVDNKLTTKKKTTVNFSVRSLCHTKFSVNRSGTEYESVELC